MSSKSRSVSLSQSKCDEIKYSCNVNDIIEPIKYSAKESIKMLTGYDTTTKIAKTLQGSVYNASKNGNNIVIKRAFKGLHTRRVGIVDGKQVSCHENIVNEGIILKYLTSKKPRNGLVKYIDFVEDDKNYFLLMENGGKSLFKHVLEMHKRIDNNELHIKTFQKHVRIIFKQMIKFIDWLHNKAKLAHLDISLENILIKGCVYKNGKFIRHGKIGFIDFGLSQAFVNIKNPKTPFICTKFVGKCVYKAPKVYKKKLFDAKKADIWSLGVTLFMISVCIQPFEYPTKKDPMFCNIINGYMHKWLKKINKSQYICQDLLSLFRNIFCDEHKRFNSQEILKHVYIKNI